MKGLTEGIMVHYVTTGSAQHRAAIAVNAWNHLDAPCEGNVNLYVFANGANDVDEFPSDAETQAAVRRGQVWLTSVCFNEEGVPGTWHWTDPA